MKTKNKILYKYEKLNVSQMEDLQGRGVGKKCALAGATMAGGMIAGAVLLNPWAVITTAVGGAYFYLGQCMDQHL